MSSFEEDLKFLKFLLRARQVLLIEFDEYTAEDVYKDIKSNPQIPQTNFIFRRAAQLVEKQGLDSTIFEDLIPTPPQSLKEFKKNFDNWKKKEVELITEQIKVLARAITRMEASKEDKNKTLPPHYIPVQEISNIIRRRPFSIARSLRNADFPVIKKDNKNYCDPEHAAILFSKWKRHWKEHQQD